MKFVIRRTASGACSVAPDDQEADLVAHWVTIGAPRWARDMDIEAPYDAPTLKANASGESVSPGFNVRSSIEVPVEEVVEALREALRDRTTGPEPRRELAAALAALTRWIAENHR